MKKIVGFFADNHILTNFIVLFILGGAIYIWQIMPKEEMPEITADSVIVSATYPGATATEVEHFVTSEIEDALEGIDGIDYIESRSYAGGCSVTVNLETGYADYDEAVDNINDAVERVKLPSEIENDPVVRERKSSNKPVLDIAIFNKDIYVLDVESRQKLQDCAELLNAQLNTLTAVNEMDIQGMPAEKINIEVNPELLKKYDISYLSIISALNRNNLRVPAGILEQEDNASVTVFDELDSIEKLKNTVIRSSFSGKLLRLKDVAEVRQFFEKKDSITKINGHEGIMITIRKDSDIGIIEAVDTILAAVDDFFKTSYKDSSIDYFIYRDESQSVRDRLSLISSNGIIGFILILAVLFIFLNFRSGLWVAMGIPFALSFTLLTAYLAGYSINNMTLAAIIIVLGIVVDDAIIIAENIIRKEDSGLSRRKAVTLGSVEVIQPIAASVLTTCAAFVPLLFFEGMIGKLIKVIPFIIFLMLAGSMLEAIFILPSHMNYKFGSAGKSKKRNRFFHKVEDWYASALKKIIRFRWVVYILAIVILLLSGLLLVKKMRFELFPREEIGFVMVQGNLKAGTPLARTEKEVRAVEKILSEDYGKYIDSYYTSIGMSRRGRAADTGEFSIFINMVSSEERDIGVADFSSMLDKTLKKFVEENDLFMNAGVARMRFGASSGGSPIVVEILNNSDTERFEIAERLKKSFSEFEGLKNATIERQLYRKNYAVTFDKDLLARLSVTPSNISEILRSVISGTLLFYHYRGDVEIPVRISVNEKYLQSMKSISTIPVANSRSYLIPLGEIMNVSAEKTLSEIRRKDGKRILRVYADFVEGGVLTAMDVAYHFESEVFPEILKDYPGAELVFAGEVEQTRESGNDLLFAGIITLLLIYFILALLFKSMFRPLLIVVIIPFGLIGAILAFYFHGIIVYGVFAVIGILGLTGVVVNDSIVMIDKLIREAEVRADNVKVLAAVVAEVSKTRLRAVVLTTVTTAAGLLPTAYGILGYDSMLSDMMLAMAYGLLFGTLITLILVPCLFTSVLAVKLHTRMRVEHVKLCLAAGKKHRLDNKTITKSKKTNQSKAVTEIAVKNNTKESENEK